MEISRKITSKCKFFELVKLVLYSNEIIVLFPLSFYLLWEYTQQFSIKSVCRNGLYCNKGLNTVLFDNSSFFSDLAIQINCQFCDIFQLFIINCCHSNKIKLRHLQVSYLYINKKPLHYVNVVYNSVTKYSFQNNICIPEYNCMSK